MSVKLDSNFVQVTVLSIHVITSFLNMWNSHFWICDFLSLIPSHVWTIWSGIFCTNCMPINAYYYYRKKQIVWRTWIVWANMSCIPYMLCRPYCTLFIALKRCLYLDYLKYYKRLYKFNYCLVSSLSICSQLNITETFIGNRKKIISVIWSFSYRE